MSEQYLYAALILAMVVTNIWSWHDRKQYRIKMAKEITAGLVRRIVIVEGRCPKCDERIPDELLTNEDMKKQGQVIV